MTLADIKNYVYRRTKTNSTNGIPAADMLIMANNALEFAESIIREWVQNYNATRWTSSDLSTGTVAPAFYSRFHEIIPLHISWQYANENGQRKAVGFERELNLKAQQMRQWYGLRKYRITTVVIATGVFTLDNHKFRTNDRVIVETTGALPTGLSAETWYYVIRTGDHTFTLSATRDGSAIATSGSQSGTHFIGRETQGRFIGSNDSCE